MLICLGSLLCFYTNSVYVFTDLGRTRMYDLTISALSRKVRTGHRQHVLRWHNAPKQTSATLTAWAAFYQRRVRCEIIPGKAGNILCIHANSSQHTFVLPWKQLTAWIPRQLARVNWSACSHAFTCRCLCALFLPWRRKISTIAATRARVTLRGLL